MIARPLIRNVRLGIRTLWLHRTRSLLTMLGIIFGVSSVIAMLSIGEGASKEAMERILRLGSCNILLRSKQPPRDPQSGQSWVRVQRYGLLNDDMRRLQETFPHIRHVVPVRQNEVEGRLRERLADLRVVGTEEEWFEVVQRPVLAGRVLTAADRAGAAHVCVLTESGARKLLANTEVVGEKVFLGRDVFEIVGVVESSTSGEGLQTPDSEADAYIPLHVFSEVFGIITNWKMIDLHQMIVAVDGLDAVEPVAEAIRNMQERFHEDEDYTISVPLELLREAEATKRTYNIVLGSIAGISLLVGGIGIMNIMLASVVERTREIGIRRAVGAKRRQIAIQFLIETMVLSCTGGLIGIALGCSLPWAVTQFADMPTVIPLYAVLLAVGVSLATGVTFGLYPAIRASRLDPIEALRHE